MNKDLVIEDVINGSPLHTFKVDKTVTAKTCGCYAIFCDETQKYYIGSSEKCKQRKAAHFGEMKRGIHSNAGIRKDFKKYTASAFHFFMLEECEKHELEAIEKKWYGLIGKERIYNEDREITRPKNKKKWPVKHGNDNRKHAVLMLKHGYSYEEIFAVTGIDKGYLRTLNFRIKRDEEQAVSTVSETHEFEGLQDEKIVSIEPEKVEKENNYRNAVSKIVSSVRNFVTVHFDLMSAAFYLLNGTACFAVFDTVPGVPGASMATIYALFSLDAILRVKRADMPNAAQVAAMRVVALEIIAALFHFRLINEYLWHNLDKLPFEVYYGVEHGRAIARQMDGDTCINCYYHNGNWVGFIAAFCAFLMACAACHAVFFAKAAAKERVKGMV